MTPRAAPVALAAIIRILAALYLWLIWPPAQDACLDDGGCWDDCTAQCRHDNQAACHRACDSEGSAPESHDPVAG